MAPFDFKSDKHFVASSDGTTLQVFELLKPSLFLHPSSIRKAHWKLVATIIGTTDDLDADDDGLLFFDGHGKIEGRDALTKLAQDLSRLHLMVSPGGYCFQEVSSLARDYIDFGIYYLRLNDLFSWPLHGVELVTMVVAAWGRRSEMKYHNPRHEMPSSKQPGVGVSKEKYEELKRTVQQKEDEMEKLRGEMDEELEKLREEKDGELEKLREELDEVKEAKDEELRKLKKEKDEEQQRLLKKKDDELKILRKGKDVGGVISQQLRKEKQEELRKLRDEMEEEVTKLRKEKDDEQEKLENEKEEELLKRLAEKDDELQNLKKEKDEEFQRVLKKKDEELQTLRKAKHGAGPTAQVTLIRKEKDEELQKLRREKNEELENLTREKDEQIEVIVKKHEAETLQKLSEMDEELRKLRKEKDEEAMMKGKLSDQEVEEMRKGKDDELKKLRYQLSSSANELTSVKQALGQYLKTSSSVLSTGGRVLDGLSSDKEWEFHVSRRRPVPPETFRCFVNRSSAVSVPVFYLPTLTEPRLSNPYGRYYLVDEGITAEELLAPPQVMIETRSEGHFDVNNWWFTKTTHPEGGMTMMAYYDGDRYSFDHRRWGTIRIPYPNGVHFDANRNIYMANFCGKIRFCFTYRN